MREIIFKAKRKDTGEWVDGLLWKKKYDSNKIFISCFPDKDDNEEVFVVDQDTICQYTGLTAYWDDGDEEASVWEHDLIVVDYRGKTVIAEVKYECGMFILASNEFVDSYILLFDVVILEDGGWVDAKVIGNVFDNPELLKEGAVWQK